MVRPKRIGKTKSDRKSAETPTKKKKLVDGVAQAITEDDPLKRININCAGIDIGSKSHYVAVPASRDTERVREFSGFTKGLYEIADWLKKCRVDSVVMESTGVYWIPLFEVLESCGFEVVLVNAHYVHNLPGRKTDVLDCQWLQELHTFGLLSGSFRPPEITCILRVYLRQRANLIRYAGSHIQHMQKALNQMNIQLHHAVSDITGVTGMGIIHAILAGERDLRKLAALRDRRCKNPESVIRDALEGTFREEHLFELRQAVDLVEYYQTKIADCDQQIERHLGSFESETTEKLPPRKKVRKAGRNDIKFDIHGHLYRMTGVDLTQIDGLDAHTILKVISETGTDMTPWKTEKHFASWLGLCPGSKITGGKRLSGKTKPSANRAAAAFRIGAQSLHHSKSALGAFYRRLKARIGAPKATTAAAHKLAKIFYHLLKNGEEYVDAGQEYYEKAYQSRVFNNLKRKAKEMGFILVNQDGEVITAP